jgi:hypothetical protein
MLTKTFIAADNGVSGSIGIITPEKSHFYHTPVFKQLNYTKEKAWINRLDTKKFREILSTYILNPRDTLIVLERPLVNPMRFKATISAVRCLEATMIVIEELGIGYEFLDSKQWQKVMLPAGLSGDELKKASLDVGKRMFPHLADKFKIDADSILMAAFIKQRETRQL